MEFRIRSITWLILLSFVPRTALSVPSSEVPFAQKVAVAFDESRTADDFVSRMGGLATQEDRAFFLKAFGKDFKRLARISYRGEKLVVAYGQEEHVIERVDSSGLEYRIDGHRWTYNPFAAAEENTRSLAAVLGQQTHGSASWLIPEAHAIVPLVAIALIVGAIAAAYYFYRGVQAMSRCSRGVDKLSHTGGQKGGMTLACLAMSAVWPLTKHVAERQKALAKKDTEDMAAAKLGKIKKLSCPSKGQAATVLEMESYFLSIRDGAQGEQIVEVGNKTYTETYRVRAGQIVDASTSDVGDQERESVRLAELLPAICKNVPQRAAFDDAIELYNQDVAQSERRTDRRPAGERNRRAP